MVATSSPKPRKAAPPVLVRQVRNGVEESVHRGDIVEVDVAGQMLRALGDPGHVVNLRSSVKPFALTALIEAGGVRELELEPAEIAIMAASHSGEDLHVRTLQAMFRRTGVSQSGLAIGNDDLPIDALTAARLARDGERPGDMRHMCSGYHASFLLLARLGGWPVEEYWREDHPTQVAARESVAAAFGTQPSKLVAGTDACGVQTFAFPLREIARAYAFLADPESVQAGDPRTAIAGSLRVVRDAMLAHPEMVGGSRDRLDTSVAKALPGRVVAKGGAEGLRCFAILPGPRARGSSAAATGLALKVEDGGASDRATSAASVEALAQAGVLDGQPLRMLGRYHRPVSPDPRGRPAAEAIAAFELAPIGELLR
ncbi:MAG TPA: asparaginase [Candidatus Limnocylindria bacterium]|nr:asparaginase [Candidatus Limnocylindria bacterium]